MKITACVLLCHFLSALSVLGMPIFMPRMLAALGGELPDYLVGVLFALPSICTAITATSWGRFADRYSKRISLLRAQLGLTVGFLLCGFAESLPVFVLGLVVQGSCGGTMAASNAYLATRQQGKDLAGSLNLTQLSARLALIAGPILLGIFSQVSQPLVIYRWLALLPLLAFLVTVWFPADKSVRRAASPTLAKQINNTLPFFMRRLMLLQFLFCFSMVVTFPYFLLYVGTIESVSDVWVGFLYSLPHLVYIVLLLPISKLAFNSHQKAIVGLLILMLSSGLQWLTESVNMLASARVLFGVGMLITYNGLHELIAESVSSENSGLVFGRVDASGKWAGVVAGVSAGAVVAFLDYRLTFLLSAVSSVIGVVIAVSLLHIRKAERINNGIFSKGRKSNECSGNI
jgi:MFS family permease